MKLMLIFVFLLTSLTAQGEAFAYKEKKGHFAYFVKLPQADKQVQSTTGKKEVVYYKNGAISEAAKYVTNDRIQIAFSGSHDIGAFEKRFG